MIKLYHRVLEQASRVNVKVSGLYKMFAGFFHSMKSSRKPSQGSVYHHIMADSAQRMATLYAEKIGRPSEAKDKEVNERKLREAQEEAQWHRARAEELDKQGL